mmetsp:Transcript_18835/g.49070  ORF Transcript_18835/g.49070 Transcript_18835/m.49070 type:complete len:440 (+) Transcript_18835:418-1737(+)
MSKRSGLSLDAAEGLGLLLVRLEAAVAELGGSVHKLELDLLQGSAAGLGHQGAAQGDRALGGTWHSTLDHQEVLLDDAVVGEAAHGGDVLLGDIEVSGRAVARVTLLAQLVHLLVDLRAVMEALLTGAGHSPAHTGRVPCTNAGHLAQTTVGLAWQAGHTPALNHTLHSMTTGNGDGVDHLVGLEHCLHRHLLLKQIPSKVDLVSSRAAVDLDLHQVRLLLAPVHLLDLGVGQHADDAAVLLQLLQLGLNLLLAVRVLLHILGEGLLLGLGVVLVEPALDLVAQVLGPHGVQGAQAARGLDVAHHAHDNHGGSLNDGDGLAGLLLVQLGAGLVHIAQDVGAASLVAHEASQVGRLGGVVVLGEGLNLALSAAATLPGAEAQGTASRVFEFTVGHCCRATPSRQLLKKGRNLHPKSLNSNPSKASLPDPKLYRILFKIKP